MKKSRLLFFAPLLTIGLVMGSCDSKDKQEKTTEVTYATPLLDRELFFGNPEISGGQLSPDGQYISFLKEYEGIMNIWVKSFDAPFEDARPLTDSPRPLYGYFWSRDGKYILYVKDNDGDENMNVFAVAPDAEATETGVPESRNLTPFEEVTAQLFHASEKNPSVFMIGLNDRDKAWHDLYTLDISTGDLKLVYKNVDRVTGYDFDWDDQLRVLSKTDEQGNTVMLYKAKKELVPIYETNVNETAYIAGWNKDNSKFYLVTNKGDLDLSKLFLMDPKTGDKELLEADPEGRVDFGGLNLNRNTREIISTSYTDDKTRIYWQDKEREELYNFLKGEFPGREISFSSSTSDYGKFLFAVSGDKYAAQSWFIDVASRELIHQYTPRPDLKEVEEHLATMEPIRYASSDGLEIPAYLTLPVGMEASNLPVVVLVHGGPKGPRDYWGFNSFVQFLANRGYAVLQPNFRASGGYGKSFMNAGDLQWGKLMQDDITWGVKHLINEGIADPDRVGIMGGSYGGYATLAGLAFTPDLYACGVDIVGPSNIFTLLESVPAYWEAGRAFLYGMVGDPETEEGEARIREASPLFSADKITKPLLVIQGANDPRVKKAEADQIVIALRDNGYEVGYILADDEGHGFRKPVNSMAMFAEIERFLAPVLGGRYQEDMPEDVAKRLEEMRIDPTTVVYEATNLGEVSESLPAITSPFVEGERTFNAKISMGEQEMKMKMVRTVAFEDGLWTITDKSAGPMGESTDKLVYNESFRPISGKTEQAGQTIETNFEEDKVVLTMMGKDMEIALDGAMLSSGPGYEDLVAAMDLTEDGVVVNMPDMSTMKAKNVVVKLAETETVEGVEYRVIELVNVENESDKTTLYVDATSNTLTKVEQVIPAMNNAVMVMELEK